MADTQVLISNPNIEITSLAPDSISLKWDCKIEGVPEDSVSFEVFVKGEMADGSPFDRVQAPERNTCTISGLKEDTTYSVYVVAVHEGEDVAQVPDTDEGLVVTTPKNVPPKNWKLIAAIAGGILVALAVLLFFLLQDKKPPVIDNPVLSSVVKDNAIALSWNQAKDRSTKSQDILYKVSRTNESGEWMEAEEVQGDTTFTFTGLRSKTAYHFLVEAFDKAGNSTAFEELSLVTTDSESPIIKDRTLTSEASDEEVKIMWNLAEDNVTEQKNIRYRVSRTDDDGAWMEPQEVRGQDFFVFSGLKTQKDYQFHVDAVDEDDNSSAYDDLTRETVDTRAPEVDDVTVNADNIKQDGFTLTWKPATDNVTPADKIRYVVYVKEEASRVYDRVKADYGITSCDVSGLNAKRGYLFYVEAYDESNNMLTYDRGDNGAFYVMTPDTAPPVSKSENLYIDEKTDVTHNSIRIQWEPAFDNTTPGNAIRYKVWLSKTQDPWKVVYEGTGISSYLFKNLEEGTRYHFYVEAFDESGNKLSIPSNGSQSQVTRDNTPPKANSDVMTVTNVSGNSFSIKWDAAYDNVTSKENILYKVWLRAISYADTWHTVHERKNITSYTFTGLKDATKYAYYVEAFDEAGKKFDYPKSGTQSIVTLDKTPPTVDSGARSVQRASTSITIGWNSAKDNVSPANKIYYKFYRKVGNSWKVEKQGYNITSGTASGLSINTKYDFRIEAIDEAGNIFNYEPISVWTMEK